MSLRGAARRIPFEAAIPDIFIIAGQSNNSGRGTNPQSYSHATLTAYLYGNDYVYKELADPMDANTNQVDAVSGDADAAGSYVPLLATQIMASTGKPVVFVPCAKGGTSITDWQPKTNHYDRTTLYGSMAYRTSLMKLIGNVRGVIWWQGEREVVLGTEQATYNAALDALANAIKTDLDIPTIVCKLEDMSTYLTGYDNSAVNAAIAEAWADNANVKKGADFSDVTPAGDGVHLASDEELGIAADRWWVAIKAVFGWS